MRPILLLATAMQAASCAMPFDFGLDVDGFRTVVVTEILSPNLPEPKDEWLDHRPRLFDTTTDELVLLGSESGRYLVAMWPDSPAELGLDAATIRASTGDRCDSFEVRLDQAETRRCVVRGTGEVPCTDWFIGDTPPIAPESAPTTGRKLGVISGRDPSACDTGFKPLSNFTLVNLDVQSGTVAAGAFERVSAGRASVVAPLGDGRVVLGQYSAKPGVPPRAQDSELATFVAPTSNTSTSPLPNSRVRTSTLWSAGSRRDGDSAWLGSSSGRLAYYTYRTDHAATLTDVIDFTPQVGSIVELVAHPDDPERIYAATSACGLIVREPGAGRWTTLVAPLAALVRRVPLGEGCAPRIAMVAPRIARVVGIPHDPNGEVTPANYGHRTEHVLLIDGQQVTAERPNWPGGEGFIMHALRGVVVLEESPGEWVEIVMGSAYTEPPNVLESPYDFGRGASWVFVRAAGSRDPWAPVRVASVFRGESAAEPILFGDAAPISVQDGANTVKGFVAGAHLRLHLFDIHRYRAKLGTAMVAYENLWHSTGSYPFATRVRDDGRGGIIFGTGDDNDAHAEFPKRFHWLSPRR